MSRSSSCHISQSDPMVTSSASAIIAINKGATVCLLVGLFLTRTLTPHNELREIGKDMKGPRTLGRLTRPSLGGYV